MLWKLLALVLLAAPLPADAQPHPSLESTIRFARERGYRASSVDWARVDADARTIAATEGEDAAIRFVLKALGDGHSSYRPPSHVDPAAPSRAPRAVRRVAEPLATVEGIPVLRINGWSGTRDEAVAATAELRAQLVEALAGQSCGVVLDFTGNSGGNMWPMLIGLSPLLTEGVLGYFEDAGGATTVIAKRGNAIVTRAAPHPLNRAATHLPAHDAHRVAIALGPRSSSSGEIVPVLFHGQGNVRFFGRPTSGHSTVNSSFHLPNGGIANITTGVTLDRNRTRFGGRIVPDVASDQPVAEGARWVSGECRGR
ncbi:MAG TPA: S41 family peptidase [Lysobacter sp.]|nr:S41 family peptidase [Lysobacter sp.]